MIHLLRKINLALCCERNEELYLNVFDTISNLSEISVTDFRCVHPLMTNTTRLVTSRRKKKTTTELADYSTNSNLIKSCKTLSDITKAVTENRIMSMFAVVELMFRALNKNKPNIEDTILFLSTLETACCEKKLQKVSRQYLDINIAAMNYSNHKQSDQINILLNKLKNNDKLSSNQENSIVKRERRITIAENTEYKDLYPFKYPGTGICEESGSR